MTGLVLIFVVVFVLVMAAVCALLVLRMASPMELPESPPFPRRRTHTRRHLRPLGDEELGAVPAEDENLVRKS